MTRWPLANGNNGQCHSFVIRRAGIRTARHHLYPVVSVFAELLLNYSMIQNTAVYVPASLRAICIRLTPESGAVIALIRPRPHAQATYRQRHPADKINPVLAVRHVKTIVSSCPPPSVCGPLTHLPHLKRSPCMQ
jgi:hypothetical protein